MGGTRIICPKCDGEGHLINRGQQVAMGILTLGMWPLMDAALSNSAADSMMSRKCPQCDGTGVLLNPKP